MVTELSPTAMLGIGAGVIVWAICAMAVMGLVIATEDEHKPRTRRAKWMAVVCVACAPVTLLVMWIGAWRRGWAGL